MEEVPCREVVGYIEYDMLRELGQFSALLVCGPLPGCCCGRDGFLGDGAPDECLDFWDGGLGTVDAHGGGGVEVD